MRILLCCAGGFSTNMLMQNMKKVIKESKKLNIEDFKFTAIPADSLEAEIDNWDIVLVGPQISHKIDFIESLTKPRNIPCAVIDKDVYGNMDGATVLKLALVTHRKHELQMNKK
ncbi:PTS system, cellobiose-specific IIB component [Clostridium cavendishii DSM 21758]|uniref:PTS system, cellobiose-specific IIB component n=1 Tax=Clostridium cavendishii DSM 21758 TaxID=1121302 RepID=A0A1M6SIR4_9CLOT|nr:PTS sugar transporter subunit IIB [Clostridium cavendishii]SHK44664.1 PTS system, cellobiose-specific IIB component [Clostridium cavendishii DSM 21758]